MPVEISSAPSLHRDSGDSGAKQRAYVYAPELLYACDHSLPFLQKQKVKGLF